MNALRNSINNMKKKRNLLNLPKLGGFDWLCSSKQKVFAELYEFEQQTISLHHRQCSRCKRVTLLHETDLESKKLRKNKVLQIRITAIYAMITIRSKRTLITIFQYGIMTTTNLNSIFLVSYRSCLFQNNH